MSQKQKPFFPIEKTLLESEFLQNEGVKQAERRYGIQKIENPLLE